MFIASKVAKLVVGLLVATTVTLPASMRTIGAYAFRANGMRSLTYPSGVYHIGIKIY